MHDMHKLWPTSDPHHPHHPIHRDAVGKDGQGLATPDILGFARHLYLEDWITDYS